MSASFFWRSQAAATAQRLARWLSPQLIGDAARVTAVPLVRADAPAGGAIQVAAMR